MHIPLRECFKTLPIIAVGCLLHSLFKIQLAGECPVVITTCCDHPHMRGKQILNWEMDYYDISEGGYKCMTQKLLLLESGCISLK